MSNFSSNLLITGGCGMLGRALMKTAKEWGYSVRATYHNTLPADQERKNYFPLDLMNPKSILDSFQLYKPHFVIHTAALTNVDQCETEKDLAWQINVKATSHVSGAVAAVGSRMVYISADYVFDGEKGNYAEEDEPNPVNYYGQTKLEGEFSTRKLVANAIIIRTSIHGWKNTSHSFSSWIASELDNGNKVRGIVDQTTSVMYSMHLAEAILKLIATPFFGTLHIASRDKISKFEFAKLLANTFQLNESLVIPAKAEEMVHWKAPRPRDVSLCVNRAEKVLGYRLPTILEGLERMKLDPR